MNQLLNKVTITGADDSVYPETLLQMSRVYPFVEWGILMSRSNEGSPRFPTQIWINELIQTIEPSPLGIPLSAHICGYWVRDICRGGLDLYYARKEMLRHFTRMQLNFHAITHTIEIKPFIAALMNYRELGIKQFIFQLDGVNNDIFEQVHKRGINAVPLFDTSGGAGILPDKWVSLDNDYCGYAGGLSPDNLTEQLTKIAQVAHYPIWIDVESNVRSFDDKALDLRQESRFLNVAKDWVK